MTECPKENQRHKVVTGWPLLFGLCAGLGTLALGAVLNECLATRSIAAPPAAEMTTVTQRIEGRSRTFRGTLVTKFEGMTLALLGSCSAETTGWFGSKEHWDKALKGDHVLVKYAKPRVLVMSDEQDSAKESQLTASEILVPIGPTSSPPQIYVRSGTGYRSFCKYEHPICIAFQKELQGMPLPRNSAPSPRQGGR